MNTLVVNIINKCNLNCPFCFGPQKDDNILSVEDFTIMIKDSTHKYVVLTGWEPLLHYRINELIKIAYDHGKKVLVHTNWILLTAKFFEVNRKYIYRLNIPLDSIDSRINAKLRWPVHLQRFQQALELIKTYGVNFSISTALTKINIRWFYELAEYIQEIKPAIRRIFQYNNYTWALSNSFFVEKEIVLSLAKDLSNYDINYKIILAEDTDFHSNYSYKEIPSIV